MNRRFPQMLTLGVVMLAIVSLTACGTSTDAASSTPAEGATPGVPEIPGGGDEPTVIYTDTGAKVSFRHPQSWTKTTQPGETIRFTGRDEFISVTIVKTTLSPAQYAAQDAAGLAQSSPNFQGQAPQNARVANTNASYVAYSWQEGPSAVTGKLVPSQAIRFYIPSADGRMAVYTYSAPNQVFDPAGALDFANTFVWQ